jgi:hypothetical protein
MHSGVSQPQPAQPATSSGRSDTRPTPEALRLLAIVVFFLLLAQFLIGMLVNFGTLPDSHPGTNAPEYFSGVVLGDLWALFSQHMLALQAHVALGALLGLAALALIWLAIVARVRAWIVASALGFVGILAAGFNGASFLNYGYDFSSFLMALGFILALCAYSIGLYVTR